MIKERFENFIASANTNLTIAMKKIDDNANGIVFVLDDEGVLCGAVSDGDIRRWILKGNSLEVEISKLMNSSPISIKEDDKDNVIDFMHDKALRALPVVDLQGKMIDIVLIKELESVKLANKEKLKGVSVVIMAGGKGTRLYPYTKILPKPLIPIGEIPIVERVIDSYNSYGVTDIIMTVNYKKRMIQSYFNELEKQYCIEYVEEDRPLGTGGSIKLINREFKNPLFVANCDCLIRTDYSKLYKHHLDSNNAITIVTALKNDVIPYGVIQSSENGRLEKIVEKPTRSYFINSGMYIINPEMIDLIPDDEVFHMTDLISKAQELGYQIGVFPISEDSFLDMGEFAEMKRMEEKLKIQ